MMLVGSNFKPLCIDVHSTQPIRTYVGKLIHMSQLVFFVHGVSFKVDAFSMVTFLGHPTSSRM